VGKKKKWFKEVRNEIPVEGRGFGVRGCGVAEIPQDKHGKKVTAECNLEKNKRQVKTTGLR